MKALKLAAIVSLLFLGIAPARADRTNLVQNINLRLFGMKQGATTTNRNWIVTSVDTVRLDTRQVIQSLATATGNTFSSGSRLVLVSPVDGGASSVQVRDGSATVDVTSLLVLEPVGTSVTSATLNTRTGGSVQNTYGIQRCVLQDAEGYQALNVHFDVNGLGVETDTSNIGRRPGNGLNIDVTGTGNRNGTELIVQGSISVGGGTIEVVVDGTGTGMQ